MAKQKDIIKTLTTSALLNRLTVEEDDELWSKIFEEVETRSPFGYIEEQLNNTENRLEEIEKSIEELRILIRTHAHLNNVVVTKV